MRVRGLENVPDAGGALLVSNHLSYIDGFLVGVHVPTKVRFMVWEPFFRMPVFGWFLRKLEAIPVPSTGPKGLMRAMQQARKDLEAGHVVCIFGEGEISRTGNTQPFKPGLERVVEGLNVPVIPVHLDRVWGSVFSYSKPGGLRTWPRRLRYPITVSFGRPMNADARAAQVRQAVVELSADAFPHRKTPADTLPERFLRMARTQWGNFAMGDSTGRELTYGRLAIASVLLSNWTKRSSKPGEYIGVVLPSSCGGAIVNIGISLAGRVPVNLNFTTGREAMQSAISQCNMRVILTSKVFLAKAKVEQEPCMVFLEDILKSVTGLQKLEGLLRARLAPVASLVARRDPDSLATVLFSSGSTSLPKGVMLTHYNIVSNCDAVLQVFNVKREDRVVGVVPFFHSFGFMATIWLPLLAGCGVAFHPNPTEAHAVGDITQKYGGTILFTTSTFAGNYARRCTKQQFASLRLVVAGAEKLRATVQAAFQEAFGLSILEGYGCTELSPVVAINLPDYEQSGYLQRATKEGSVGRPIPGTALRVVHPETMEPRTLGEEGLLLVKGPNVMQGYLGQPEKTAEAIRDGWYVTGDIAYVDDEGFLTITDRISRFTKIGGEMVPHGKVEETIRAILGHENCAVTGIPDEKRGERLAVLYVDGVTPAELGRKLNESELPNLWIPKVENLYSVVELPVLATGKLDLRRLKSVAVELAK